jgi:hypothetical protein
LKKEILTVIGITILFLGVGIQPAIATVKQEITSESTFNHNISNNETFLEVNAKVFGILRINFIAITQENNGDEKVEILYQDRGFEIYNSEHRVYRTKYIFPRIWYQKILLPRLPRIFHWDLWFGFDDSGKILTNGEYFVKGWVYTEFGTLYSELVGFHLGKP